jgi:hypothetical protein
MGDAVSHTDDDDFRWDGPALRDASLDCLHGAHSALTADDRTQEVLRGIGLALLAMYEQRSEFYGQVATVLSDAKGRSQ